jgi:hypothetical protein
MTKRVTNPDHSARSYWAVSAQKRAAQRLCRGYAGNYSSEAIQRCSNWHFLV